MLSTLIFHEQSVLAVGFSPRGDSLFTLGNDEGHLMAVWTEFLPKTAVSGHDRRTQEPPRGPLGDAHTVITKYFTTVLRGCLQGARMLGFGVWVCPLSQDNFQIEQWRASGWLVGLLIG